MFNVTIFDAVIRKLIYALWRICLAVVIVPILLITCLPQTFSFSRSCLNAGDNYCTLYCINSCIFLPREALLSAIFAHFADAISSISPIVIGIVYYIANSFFSEI